MSAILASQEAEIRRIEVRSQPGEKVSETASQQMKAASGGTHLSSQLHKKYK
jgi:hypothetical protein